MKKFALLASFVVLTLAATVDISNAVYESIMTLNNTSSTAQEDVTAEFNISGYSLVDSGFMDADTLDAAVAEGSTLVRSQPPSDRIRMLGCVQSDSGTTTAYTTECNSSTADDVPLLPSGGAEVGDSFYFGADWPYRILPIDVSTPATEDWGNGDWEYWNGDWTEHSNVADNTELFTNSGVRAVSWDTPRDWEKTTVDGTEAFWTRLNVTEVSATTTDPLASTAEWETGMWWTFTESLSGQEQKQYTLALGGSDMVDNHAFFPGEEGYVTADAAALEPGSEDFKIDLTTYLSVESSATSSRVFEKEDALELIKTASGELSLIVNGATSSPATVSGITNSEYSVSVSGDGANAVLTVDGVGNDSVTYSSINDNSNEWIWGSESVTPYINSVAFVTPLLDVTDTTAQWDTGTHSNTDGISGNLSLIEVGTDIQNCEDQSLIGWNVTGWTSAPECYIEKDSSDAIVGDNVFHMESNGGTSSGGIDSYSQISSQSFISVEPSTSYSFIWYCRGVQNTDGIKVRIQWRHTDTAFISTDDFESSDCATGSMTKKNNALTSPSGANLMDINRVRLQNDDNIDDVHVHFDCFMIIEGGGNPDCPGEGVTNILVGEQDWKFSQIHPTSGNRVSPDFDVSSVTEVESSAVRWSDNLESVSADVTYEITLDSEATWQEVESSGDPIPGIQPGDDLSGQAPLRSRVTITGNGEETVLVDVLTLEVLDTSGETLTYRPQERIGLSLTDETGSGNDATSSFPTASIDSITTDMSALQGTGNVTIEDIQTQPEVIPQQSSTQSFLEGGTGSSLPFHDIFAAFADESGIPVLAFWVTVSCVVILMVGVAVARFSQSSAASVFAMVFTALMFTQLGTNGILPMWVLLFFAISAGGSLLAARGMRI